MEARPRPEPAVASPSVTLAMIVKDEAAVIGRLIDSVRPLIDQWVIVDTGSTDGTPDLVAQLLADRPGRVEHRPWVDFGHNRSELMTLARGQGTHLLLVDADMTVRIDGPVVDLDDEVDAWLLCHDGTPRYWIPRLVRADRPWRFEGATHEYLTADLGRPMVTRELDALAIEHHADGGARADKFTRDRDLLTAHLERHPDDPRTVFHLANTLRDLGATAAAVAAYRRRVTLGGWREEVYDSRYNEGLLLAPQDWDGAVDAFLAATRLCPDRAEPLLELARGHRSRGRYALADHFARLGLGCPEPGGDALFVHLDAYRWALRFEAAIAAYHLGRPAEALALNEQLLVDGVPEHIEPWVHHNRAWCRWALGRADADDRSRLPLHPGATLPALADLVPVRRSTEVAVPVPAGWSCFNPSIAAVPADVDPEPSAAAYRCVVRTASYRLDAVGGYTLADLSDGPPAPRGVERRDPHTIVTVNHLLALDPDLRPVGAPRVLSVDPDRPVRHPSRVEGVEDLRLIAHDGRWWGFGTVRDRAPGERCQMARVDLGPVGVPAEPPDEAEEADDGLAVLDGPDPFRHEKNWMPFVDHGELRALYLCDPTVVVAVGPSAVAGGVAATAPVVSERAGPPGAAGFRGGSPGLAIEEGWLFVVHEVVAHGPMGRAYAHRLVHLVGDPEPGSGPGSGPARAYRIEAVSPPFTLGGGVIEFCAGLAAGADDTVVLSWGSHDAAARLTVVDRAALLALLVPVRPPRR